MAIKQAVYDIVIYRGDSLMIEMQLFDVDDLTGDELPTNLTDMSLAMQARYDYDISSIWLNFNAAITDAAQGKIQVLITAQESADLVPPDISGSPVSGRYDMQLTDINNPSAVFTPLLGAFRIEKDVTRL